MNRSDENIPLALVAAVAGPVIGFLTMALIWATVSSDGRGGMDWGVILLGGAVAATFVGCFAQWKPVRPQSVVPWLIAAFLVTVVIASGVVWLFYAGPFSFDFSGMD